MKFININFLKTNKIDVILTQNKIRGGFESEYFLYIKNNFISTNKISDMSKIDYSGVFLKNINFNGKFLKSLNYLNIVNYLFFKNFFKKSNFLEKKFNNYNIFYNFSQSNGFFFDINFILQNIYLINEAIFTTKIIKINKKKLKRKTNKFNFEIKYLKKKNV